MMRNLLFGLIMAHPQQQKLFPLQLLPGIRQQALPCGLSGMYKKARMRMFRALNLKQGQCKNWIAQPARETDLLSCNRKGSSDILRCRQ